MRPSETCTGAPALPAEPSAPVAGNGARDMPQPSREPSKANRREVLAAAALAASAAGLSASAAAQGQAPRMARPAPGDVLVFAAGDKAGKPVTADALAPGAPQVLAWAMEPGSGVVRSGSRLNQVILLRLDPASLEGETAARAAQGIVAYSAVCTHAQCPVSEWRSDKGVLHCPCHQSEFDPKQGGKVVGGPAPRSLAALPIRAADGVRTAEGEAAADGVLVVDKPFVGKIGAATT